MSTKVDFDEDGPSPPKKIKKDGLQRGSPGIDYQVQLLMLFAYQGYQLSTQRDEDFLFELGTERTEAGKFDDIIVRHKQNQNQEWNYLLMQAKYTEKRDAKITTGQLLSRRSEASFTLLKYFSSFLKSKRIFEARGEKIGSCAIVTNNNFNYNSTTLKINTTKGRGKSFYLKKLTSDQVNPIFQTPEMKEVKYFKFDETKGIVEELKNDFKKAYDIIARKQKKKDTDKDILKNLEDIKGNEAELDKEVKNFVDTLLYVVELPNRSTVREIIKAKIGEELRWLDDSIINTFNIMMFNYTITSGKPFLEGSEIEDFFLKMRQIINDIVFRFSYYPRMQNVKIDLVHKEIMKSEFNDFLRTQSGEKILLLKTDSMLLSAIKLNQILEELSLEQYSYYNKHNFLNHEALIEINNLEDETIKSFEVEDGCNLLIIICDNLDVNIDKIKGLQTKLYNVAIRNTFKKVVFIIEHNSVGLEIEMNKECFLNMNDANHFSNLTDNSKRRLLDKTINFQAKNIPLKQLYFKLEDNEISSEQLNQLDIDMKTLESLLKGSIEIVKQFSISSLEGAYSKICEEINTDVLIERLREADDRFFVISSIDESAKKNAFIENLKSTSKKPEIDIDHDQICILPRSGELYTQHIKKVNLVDSRFEEENFKQLCHNNPHKIFYWIKWENNKFIFDSSYYPKFLKRKFKNPKKHIIPNNKKLLKLLKNNGVYTFFITGADGVEDLFEVLPLQNEREQERLKENRSGNIIFQNNGDEGKKFSELFGDEAKDVENVYWVHIKKDNDISKQIIWRDVTREPVSQKKLRNIISDKSSIIIDKPGMGKSTALTILSQKMLKSHWVMLITLGDWQEAIRSLPANIDINTVVEFLSKTKNLRTPLEKNLVKHILDKNYEGGVKLLLSFDGFDEIRTYDAGNEGKKKFEGLLRFLKEKTQCTIWITAREHDATTLKTTLSVFDIKFEPLCDNLQKKYFKNVWRNSLALRFSENELDNIFSSEDSKFEEYYQALSSASKKMLENKHNDFMGIPLTLRLFAEGFRSKFMEFIDSPKKDFHKDLDNLNIFSLYQYFINEKFKIFLREKTNLSSCFIGVLEDWLKEKLMKLHWKLAFYKLFGEKATRQLVGIKKPFKKNGHLIVDNEQLSGLLSFGIIRSIKEDHYEFLHRTLAEYFVSEMFINQLECKKNNNLKKYEKIVKFLKKNIWKESNKIIYRFMEARCEQNSTLKDVWRSISITDTELKNLLGPGRTRNIFIFKTIIQDDIKDNIVEENVEDLKTKMMKWIEASVLEVVFSYPEDFSNCFGKFVQKSLLETDLDQLIDKMEFLLKTYVLELEKDNPSTPHPNVIKVFDHFILQVEKQNLFKRYANFIQNFSKRFYYELIDHELQELIVANNQNICETMHQMVFVKRKRRTWLEGQGQNLVMGSLVLTKKMACIFNSLLPMSSNIFNSLIIRLLRYKYIAKYDPMVFTEIDSSALLNMFQTFSKSKESPTLCAMSLKGLLECIEYLLLPGNISEENFIISMESLIMLKDWNFSLAYKIDSFSLYHNTEDYCLPLELQHSAKIKTLLLSRLRADSASFDLRKECRHTFQSISEAPEEQS